MSASLINGSSLPYGNIEDYTLILCRPDHTRLGRLEFFKELHIVLNLNQPDELSFEYYCLDDHEMKRFSPEEQEQIRFLWEEMVDFKYIYVKELNEYFEIYISYEEDQSLKKSITGKEAVELDRIRLYDLEINSEDDIAREDYVTPTIFYDPKPENKKSSLLHRVLSKAPNWTVGEVDESLRHIQRTFTANDTSIYDFLVNDVAEEIECLFVFDTVERKIHVHDLNATCKNCGYRGEFQKVCPKCESTDYYPGFGDDTTILIDVENLAEEITYDENSDEAKNCFRLEAGDDDMTAAIRNINPNGSNYICYFSEAMKHEMPKELVKKLDEYTALSSSIYPEYKKNTAEIYDLIEEVWKLEHTMMPEPENPDKNPTQPTAQSELNKILEELRVGSNIIGVSSLSKHTTKTVPENAIRSWAKMFVDTGKYKVSAITNAGGWEGDVSESTYGSQKYHEKAWTGKIQLESWATRLETDKKKPKDDALSNQVTFIITDNYPYYLDLKIRTYIKGKDDEYGSAYNVLKYGYGDYQSNYLEDYKTAITLYSLIRLESFRDALNGVMDIMISSGHATSDDPLYPQYQRYWNMYKATEEEINKRQTQIDEKNARLAELEKIRDQYQEQLDFEAFLGEELFNIYCIYRREDSYENSNYISTDLSNPDLFKMAEQYYETASRELIKAAENKHTISSTVHNLLAMPDFKPFVHHFRLGNFIRLRIDGKVFRLRLSSIGLNGGTMENIDVEFTDAIRAGTGYTDIRSILDDAKKIASSYDGNMHQMRKNREQCKIVNNFVERGMSNTAVKIVNDSDRQNMVMNDSGMLMRRMIDYTSNDFEDTQTKIIGSGLYVTDDGWKTVKSAIGKFVYVDPDTGEQSERFGVIGDSIVGNLVLSHALRVISEDGGATMSFDADGFKLNAKENGFGFYPNIFTISRDGKQQMWIDSNGNLVVDANSFMIFGGGSYSSSLGSQTTLIQEVNDKMNQYFRFDAKTGLTIGDQNSPVKLVMNNETIMFQSDSALNNVLAYFDPQGLTADTVRANETLEVYPWKFIKESDETLDLTKTNSQFEESDIKWYPDDVNESGGESTYNRSLTFGPIISTNTSNPPRTSVEDSEIGLE